MPDSSSAESNADHPSPETLDIQGAKLGLLSANSNNRILIIEDDSFTRMMLQVALKKQGYETLLAVTEAEGIAQARQHRPALILCDWQMPGIDGLRVCHQIKADPELANIFVILLTARSALEDRVKGLDSGADDFLTKPLEFNELKARIRAGLRIYQSTQELRQAAQELYTLAQALQTQKQQLETELADAAEYVRSLLPSPLSGAVDIASRFLPSAQLGGDCFDYYWLDPDYLLVYLLDVSGHGLKSALTSISIQNLLRSQSLPGTNFYQPANVLKALNELFQIKTRNDPYFTIWYGIYNRQKHQLFYASAGHPPAILIAQGEQPALMQTQRLKTRGMPIGMFPDAKFVSGRCDVQPGSTLYVFSDGIYEIEQADKLVWQLDSFVEFLTDYARLNEPSDDLDQLLTQFLSFNQLDHFSDDCSLLKIRFN